MAKKTTNYQREISEMSTTPKTKRNYATRTARSRPGSEKIIEIKPLPKGLKKTHMVLVLDLDETLINTAGRVSPSTPKDRTYMVMGYHGTIRPYAKEFLEWAREFFSDIYVWTAANEEYAQEIKKILFPDWQPKALWSRDLCVIDKLEGRDIYTKPLKKMANQLGSDLSSMIIIDDNEDTMIKNKENGILIPKYNGGNTDDALYKLTHWLSQPQTHRSYDVRSVSKSNIF